MTNARSMIRIVPASTNSFRAGTISPLNWLPGNATIMYSTGPMLIRLPPSAPLSPRQTTATGLELSHEPRDGFTRSERSGPPADTGGCACQGRGSSRMREQGSGTGGSPVDAAGGPARAGLVLATLILVA